jgi:transposase
MCQVIMVACDLHVKTMVLKIAEDRNLPEKRVLANTPAARAALGTLLRERAAATGAEVVFAYEASSLGFGLYDELTAAGIRCHVLAPSKMTRSAAQKKTKNDDRDAEWILETLRGHVLAGNALPDVWVPDRQTRDDRELVRARLDAAQKITAAKSQIKGLLKRASIERPSALGKGWTRRYVAWLRGLTADDSPLGSGARSALTALLRQLAFLQKELRQFDHRLQDLAQTPRYVRSFYALQRLPGVGLVTALVYLTELGDVRRFRNRRQLSAYLGLVPSSHESGASSDRKGHITRQGPSRVRHVLCQAAWVGVRHDGREKEAFDRIAARNPKHRKIAAVASMRRLAIRMWHAVCDAGAREQRPDAALRGEGPESPGPSPRTPHPLPSLCGRPGERVRG